MFRKTLVVRALAIAFGASALTLVGGPAAYAQTSATGSVSGQVDTAAGSTVIVENIATGVRRTATPGADGKFTFSAMPVGSYRVILQRGGATVATREAEIVIGQTAEVSFAANTLQTVQIAGRRQVIDVSSVGSTTTFTAAELSRLPVATNVGAIIQLAPNTTRGDSRYGGAGAPSFGGAGASENAYYINGFPVTTLLTQVGFAQLPFNAIANIQILTGGYGAEFGRSTGGVANIVTKSGGNDLVFGVGVEWEPRALRNDFKNQYYPVNGLPNTDGKLYFYNEKNKTNTVKESIYFGGPIIKDKLFFFFAGDNIDTDQSFSRIANTGGPATAPNSTNAGGWVERAVNRPQGMLKLDWNITDSHHLEFTRIADEVKDTRRYYSFNYNTLARGYTQTGGASYTNWGPTPVAADQGAEVNILKYTGYLTSDLTLTALLGQTTSPHRLIPGGYNPALPQIGLTAQAPGLTYVVPQTTTGTLLVPGAYDKNKGGRLDIEWRINSQNTVRAGVDYNKIQSKTGSATAGGSLYTYTRTNTPLVPIDRFTAAPATGAPGNPLAAQGYYVSQTVSATTSTPTTIQNALYIEDKFQVTDRLLLSLGLRNEGFDNRNGDNQSYIKISKQLAPRLGAAWDVNGDASQVFKAYIGRYHVPLPTNVAVRAAGASLNTTQNFAYTGVNPVTGAPTGLTPLSPVFSANNEFGQSKDPREVAGKDLKGNYQDELSFGIEQALSKSLNVSAKFTYRKLRNVIDDFCDDRPFIAWAARNNVNASNFGFNCALFNPGIANHFTIDLDGDGKLENINLSAADLGYPKVKRTYVALDLSAEYPFDGKYYGKVTYSLSRNSGNTEGQLLSDIGQADVATTQAFDFPEFSTNANGLLPNDRKHQLKAFGAYQLTPEWLFGANALVASGRPKNCIGNAPVDANGNVLYNTPNYSLYGSAYFFCQNVPSPRGSRGRLPVDAKLDLNAAYSPSFIPGIKLKIDVFNVFNRQSIQTIEERYNAAGNTNAVRTTYGGVLSYSEPRYIKLSATYDYKF